VSKRVLWMARNLDDSRPSAAMEATGAKLFRGEGRLTDLRTVAVGSEQLIARRAVLIANGSTAVIPPIPNLLRNTSDAMMDVHDRPRHLLVKTEREGEDRVRVTVRDAGVGVDPQSMDKLFDAF
jgi:pyruvate/2-oxoglutarate dehydrogenase complex dihydrolipoamide dehydrogenase (E3) component